jgi:hypothetical protein
VERSIVRVIDRVDALETRFPLVDEAKHAETHEEEYDDEEEEPFKDLPDQMAGKSTKPPDLPVIPFGIRSSSPLSFPLAPFAQLVVSCPLSGTLASVSPFMQK